MICLGIQDSHPSLLRLVDENVFEGGMGVRREKTKHRVGTGDQMHPGLGEIKRNNHLTEKRMT